MSINNKFKDSVFTKLFTDKQKLIELYNSIEGTSYPPDAKIEINTLQDALFLDRINDISFVLEDRLVILIEHQSTINENLPFRFLLYISRIYEKITDNKNIYRKKLVKIPTPEFVALYNGAEDFPDERILKLSDAFKSGGANDLELKVKVLNINKGHNEQIFQKSNTLSEYAEFVARVRENIKGKIQLEEAVTEAVSYCVNNGILREFLEAHGSEVLNMLFTEFNLDDALSISREEGREKGREEGIEKNSKEILDLIQQGYTLEQIEDKLKETIKH